jgi:hypothetical protein
MLNATTQLKQLAGLIDDIRSVQLQQVEDDKEKFTSEVRVLSEDIHPGYVFHKRVL